MKDLYSAHVTESDMMSYYEKVKEAYTKIFKRLGFDFRVIEAAGGVFTERHTHEFQVLSDSGEDTVYFCDKCGYGENKEIYKGKVGDKCIKCDGCFVQRKSIEVGNIFPLGTMYAEKMGVYYTAKDGNKNPVWLASYGIGPTRVLGALVEVNHDDKGIIWHKEVSPFDVHLIELKTQNAKLKTKDVYDKLSSAGTEILWDDREVSPGEKFADADLIGIPVRLVVSEKTADKIEWKERTAEKLELLDVDEVVNRLKH